MKPRPVPRVSRSAFMPLAGLRREDYPDAAGPEGIGYSVAVVSEDEIVLSFAHRSDPQKVLAQIALTIERVRSLAVTLDEIVEDPEPEHPPLRLAGLDDETGSANP